MATRMNGAKGQADDEDDDDSDDEEFHSCKSDEEHETKSRIYWEFMNGTRMFVDPKLEWNRVQAERRIRRQREFERHARCWVYENQHFITSQINNQLRLAEPHFSINVHYEDEEPRPCGEETFQRARATVEYIRRVVGLMAHALSDGDKSRVFIRTGYVPEQEDQPMGIWIKRE